MQTIETKRLILRKFKLDDFAAFHHFTSRPGNSIYTYFWPNNEIEMKAFIDHAIMEAEKIPCEHFQYAAVTKATNILIGSCNFILSGEGGSNIGWIVDSDYWNQGYGTEMGKAMLKMGFEDFNLQRIVACCDAENMASRRVMEKIGMKWDGLSLKCRRAHKLSEKKHSDEVSYIILRDKWRV